MKTYKGFNKDMTCKGKQYEIGKMYEEEDAKACEYGMHSCEYPLDCFHYYDPSHSVFCETIADGKIDRDTDVLDTKIASTKLKIGAKLDIPRLVHAAIEYTKSHTTMEHTDSNAATAGNYGAATAGYKGAATAGDSGAATAGYKGAATAGYYGAATAGNSGAATAGDKGAATAGYSGAATAGNYGAATAGDSGAATAGYKGAATAGDSGAATAGYKGAATAGYKGAATAGDKGAATSRGKSASGKNGLSVARGNNVRVKGGLGAILVIAEEENDCYDVKDWKAVIVDGERVKADTWYKLVDGELVECEDEDGQN